MIPDFIDNFNTFTLISQIPGHFRRKNFYRDYRLIFRRNSDIMSFFRRLKAGKLKAVNDRRLQIYETRKKNASR